MIPTSKKQSRVTGAIALTISQATVLLLGYMTHLWIGRVLGPGPYGIYGVVLSIQVILGVFLTLGVPSAVSRFVAQDEQHAQSILRQALMLQTIIATATALLTLLLTPVITIVLRDAALTNLLAFTAFVVFLQAFYPVYVQFFSGLHQFNRQAFLTGIYAVAKLAGAITLLYSFGIFGAFAGFAIGSIVAGVLGWWWTRDASSNRGKKLPIKSLLSFAGMYVVIVAGLQILMSLDLFMVKSLLHDDIQAGYYNAAVTLSRISYFLLQGLSFIILPSISALTKPGASREQAVAFIQKILRYLIMLIVPSITLASATSKQLIILFFSKRYIPGAAPLSVLMLGLGALAFFLLLANIAAGSGKGKAALSLTVAMLIISATLGYLFIPSFGLMGAAWQTTIAAFVGLIGLGVYIFVHFKLAYPVRTTMNVFLATAAAVLPTYVWSVSSLFLPLQYIALLALYICVLWILKEITPEDRNQLAAIHPKLSFIKL